MSRLVYESPTSSKSTSSDPSSFPLQADYYSPYARPPASLTTLEDIVQWWKGRNPTQTSEQAPIPVGVMTGWDSSCPPPNRISRDWLDFLYWDTGTPPVIGRRFYAFQVVPKGTDGTLPFDLKAARISLTYPEMNGANAALNDQQKSFSMVSGDAIDVKYPVNRDEPNGRYVVRRVRMPKPEDFFHCYDELIEC
ncbi:hypothetical protein DL96DRAFT_1821311 [Flagelloscypha sp. PMI_526]|nr:hypothetical protein DL96DRAFT_1821311 [Flagelloscypha sp. PMI_526]